MNGQTYGLPAGGSSKYGVFKEVEDARAPFDPSLSYKLDQTCDPNFKAGQGLNNHPEASKFADDNAEFNVIQVGKTEIAPTTMYKLMVSSIVSRSSLPASGLALPLSSLPISISSLKGTETGSPCNDPQRGRHSKPW